MHDTLLNQFKQEGYLVLDDFLRPAECDELRSEGLELAKTAPDKEPCVISTSPPFKQYEKGSYFLDSGHKISYFYDIDAVSDGKLKGEASQALNKIGHGLHAVNPIFRCYTFSDRVKLVCRQLGLLEPVVAQSVYIYKNSGLRGEVPAHQDSSILFAEPTPVIGFWIALEDSTIQNGCLFVARGSHKSGVHMRLVRNTDKDAQDALIYDRPFPLYPQSSFTAVPVSKGTCVLLHGNVVYKCGVNRSDSSMNTYAFHVIEKHDNKYAEENWLLETTDQKFLPIYTTSQIM